MSRLFRFDDPAPGAWKAFIQKMHSGEVFECDEEMYWYWLEILPPVWMNRLLPIDEHGVVSTFGFAEGPEMVTAFWQEGKRYFGKRTAIVNPSR